METGWVREHLDPSDGFPRPDWDAIAARIDAECDEAAAGGVWTSAARVWLEETSKALGGRYVLRESAHFLVLSPLPDRTGAAMLAFLERARSRLLHELLPGIAAPPGPAKHVAILLADREAYHTYIAHHYPPEGEFGGSAGVRLSGGRGGEGWCYPHFVVLGIDVLTAEGFVAHELTHDCVGHLDVPAWLNEGMACIVESVVLGRPASPWSPATSTTTARRGPGA